MKDVRNKLKPEDFQAAIANLDSVSVGVDNKEYEVPRAAFKKIAFLGEVHGDIVINDCLLISEQDYVYWWSTNRRINKLLTEKKEAKPKPQSDKLMTVACANISESGIEMLKVCEGTRREVLDFINEQLTYRHLKSFGNDIVVFKFDYVDDDKKHPERWFTIEELAEKGEVVLS